MAHKLSAGEKAVQKKIERGQRLNGDDRRIVQARLRSLQARGQYNGASAIPGRTLTKSVGVRSNAVQNAVYNTARGLNAAKCPVMTSLAGQVELCRVAIEQGGTGNFGGEFMYTGGMFDLDVKWTVSGSLYMIDCHSVSSGTGAGAQSTGGGTNQTGASGSQQASGFGMSGGGGVGTNQGVSVSAPISGVNVGAGAGQNTSAGGGAGYSTGGAQSTGGTNGVSTSAGGGTSGTMMRETYFAKLKAEYTVAFEPAGWIQGTLGQGSGQTAGECDAGEVQFTVEEAA